MRWLAIGVAGLALAGCSAKPDRGGGPGDTVTDAGGVAFTYAYTFCLPSARIAALQETHAAACEQLGPARCRITGMTYRVDDSGQVGASLAVRLAAPIARAFGRNGVAAIESAGGVLAGAEIGGTDAAPPLIQAARQGVQAKADKDAAAGALARGDLPAAERAAMVERQAAAEAQAHSAATAAADARDSVAFTPMTFTYQAGSGVGLSARLDEAGHAASSSLVFTLWAVSMVAAVLGPPAILLLLGWLVWRRVGRGWWRRLVGWSDRSTSALEPIA